MRSGRDPEIARRAYEIFSEILELPVAARLPRLASLDVAVRVEVEALLAADAETHGPLDGEVAEIAVEALDSRKGPAIPGQGDVVGPYRLGRELGRGGMGRVFAAQRADSTLERRVAIKVVPAEGLGEDGNNEQFLAEGRALARLDHPHVARVFDTGFEPGTATRQGCFFLVMEWIDGVPITDQAAGLPLDERVDLFVTVCDAVEAAHREQLIHRDLKPPNVLVDRTGQPKLLDFGIAFFLDRPQKDTARLRLTPAYAAPEQVRGGSITPATDVYSLGLLLYELLTSQRAVDLRQGDRVEILRQVCDTDPPPPSQAFGEDLETVSTPIQRLRRQLRGDLDTIVMKALRKSPEQRYASAAALAEDLRRWRGGRPILARPTSPLGRAMKLVRRYPWRTAAILLIGMILTVSGLVMDGERRRADRLRTQAELEAAKAERISALMRWLFEASNPSEALGVDAPVLELLKSGVAHAQTAESPTLRAEQLEVLARAYRQLGHAAEAEEILSAPEPADE